MGTPEVEPEDEPDLDEPEEPRNTGYNPNGFAGDTPSHGTPVPYDISRFSHRLGDLSGEFIEAYQDPELFALRVPLAIAQACVTRAAKNLKNDEDRGYFDVFRLSQQLVKMLTDAEKVRIARSNAAPRAEVSAALKHIVGIIKEELEPDAAAALLARLNSDLLG